MHLNHLQALADTFPSTDPLPVLFLGHGSPMNAIEENEFVKGFRDMAATLPRPHAILCISAHWYTRGTKLTAMEMPKTIHDFGGFPPALYAVQYPAKGHPALAAAAQQILSPQPVALDHQWGLDHGAWSVLTHLYPQADVPVVQMSIDYALSPHQHYALAQQLAVLRRKGILIVGSGNIIHNLGLVDFAQMHRDNYGYDWAIEAREGMHQCLLSGDFQPLLDYQKQSTAWKLAIPTPDHYLPLVYALGLKEKQESLHLFNDKLLAGSLSMTSLKIGQ